MLLKVVIQMEDATVDEQNRKKGNTTWIKILLLVLIIAMIAGIYLYKKSNENNQNTVETQDSEEIQNERETQDSEEITQEASENTDEDSLALEISAVDLDEIKSNGLPFVIDFGSDSCIPCKQMAPVLETLHEEFQGKAIVHFVDVWKNEDAAYDFPVSVIPTQIFYNADGTPFVPSEELAQEIEFTMYSSEDTNEHLFTVHQGGITEEQMRKIFAEMGVE